MFNQCPLTIDAKTIDAMGLQTMIRVPVSGKFRVQTKKSGFRKIPGLLQKILHMASIALASITHGANFLGVNCPWRQLPGVNCQGANCLGANCHDTLVPKSLFYLYCMIVIAWLGFIVFVCCCPSIGAEATEDEHT